MDRPCQVFRSALCRRARRGKPRFTLVSEGKPLRRLLLGSKKKVVAHGSLSFRMDLPVTFTKVSCRKQFTASLVFSLLFHSSCRYTGCNLRRRE